jgi:hypothetical protein
MDEPEPSVAPPRSSLLRSRLGLRGAFVLALGAVLAFVPRLGDGAGSPDRAAVETLRCEAARAFRAHHGVAPDLSLLEVQVVFRAAPVGRFVASEGFVTVPVGVSLPGAQEVLEVRGDPEPTRKLDVDGTTLLAWSYAGAVHRDMRFVAFALIRRAPARAAALPPSAGWAELPRDMADDATLTARDLEEHGLQHCAAFPSWAQRTAGPPPRGEQVLRLLGATRERPSPAVKGAWRDAEDVCAAIRRGVFTAHQAHVAVVMAARQIGVPAFGFVAAGPEEERLVGTYVDGLGWTTASVRDPDQGFSVGGPPILTLAPHGARFEAISDGFWSALGAAYRPSRPFLQPFSFTKWAAADASDPGDDVTTAEAWPLAEVCP